MDKKNLTPLEAIYMNREAGVASLKIDLNNGVIRVYHGTDQDLLMHISNVKRGTWNKLWDVLEKSGKIVFKNWR